MSASDTFIVLREPAEARRSGWTNNVKNWYDDEQEARAEAARLCTQSGKRFVVFRAIAYVEPSAPPVEWHEGPFDPLTDLPF